MLASSNRYHRALLGAAVAGAALILTSTATAQPPPAEPEQPASTADEEGGRHRHDGFLLRIASGPGLLEHRSAGATLETGESWDGHAAALTTLSFGTSLVENLALHLDLWGMTEVGRDTRVDPDLSVGGLAVGVSYYFMPSNVYLSAFVGPSSARWRYEDAYWGDMESDSLHGLGVGLSVGKEWWVSDNWGVGLSATAVYSHGFGPVDWSPSSAFDDRRVGPSTGDDDLALHSFGTAIRLTATYH
jgi:hypothetical protein